MCSWGRVRRIWADATVHVVNGQFAGRSLTYTVERDDGEKVVVTSALNRVEDFHHRLQEKTTARLLVGALLDLREGRPVNFGPIRATPDGLQVGAETHPWPTEGPAVLHEGIMRLPRVGRSPTVALASEVANLVVLLELP
ncbi:Uncharacterized protein OS=Ktedonobacter racemifer DSM 44963 GN=Krac_2737 PE=4 SV=1 [Gemmata massiliana]|uniref:Uncharacterized protein n=1 Tax=Gemmata massiliana TaxID=1210884 RepID=A0A6P2DEC3_9BACT|nr:Uncharacterized protein OS=Ktedonobacter racemifer DSM 44963 GN=Krac_2737 PE=4 SV=1 [Gemmata massiliana]